MQTDVVSTSVSAREFELCRSRPRQGRVRCRLQRRNFRIGFYRDSTEIRPTGHRLPIANSAIRCAAPRARRPPRAGARGASGLGVGRERPAHASAAPSASPGSRYTPVRRVSRVPRRIRNRAEENKGRERPRDRSKRPDPLGCQATRRRAGDVTAASAIRLELGVRLRWENHSQILQTCPRTQLK